MELLRGVLCWEPDHGLGRLAAAGSCAHPQLIVDQFMDNGPDAYCPGCTHFTNNVVDLAGLARSGVGWATVSNLPLAQIEAYAARKGWSVPFVSSHGTTVADDCGAGGGFMLSVFLRDGEQV